MRDERKVIIIAGPNGAGKTTFAREFLPQEADCPVFVNADLIAAGLAPFAPSSVAIQAGRLMLAELDRHFAADRSFAFETTLSGCNYLARIQRWQQDGYRVKLIFFALTARTKPSPVWLSACGRAGMMCPSMLFVADLSQGCTISHSSTPR